MKQLIHTILIMVCSNQVFSQGNQILSAEQKEVFAVVQELFDAYRAGDSTRVRSVFTPNALLTRADSKDGKPFARSTPIQDFVKYVGGGLEKLHNELLWDYTISVDRNLANVWTKYAFFLDGYFHHCGSETFTLYKSDSGWKIMYLADNSMVEECKVPAEIMNAGQNK